jgi:Mn-dependent DtxR family transcriptional regulator
MIALEQNPRELRVQELAKELGVDPGSADGG